MLLNNFLVYDTLIINPEWTLLVCSLFILPRGFHSDQTIVMFGFIKFDCLLSTDHAHRIN